MKIHFIAIGGAAMHNLAIALHKKSYSVSGSDDEIFEPSKSRLKNYGLLPEETGWFPEKITLQLDAVILGMHAREDNPELIKAKELGIKIFSYPEYLYEQSKNKKRIVIAGSHGKTTITAMILHVLQHHNVDCDYMVGAQLEGFEVMVKLSEKAPIIIIEGDEYLTSPIDRRPKFHLYMPDVAVISGIAWDHINVFPTFDNYVEQFKIFLQKITESGRLIYYEGDDILNEICKASPKPSHKYPYTCPDFEVNDGVTLLHTHSGKIQLNIFGKHNLANLQAALLVCKEIGVSESGFYEAVKTFKGASKRLELVKDTPKGLFFKDFAHAPSKLKASIEALKNQHPEDYLIACLELHTFSSLNKDFLPLYKNSMGLTDLACVYFNPATLAHKKLPPLEPEQIKAYFNNPELVVFNDSKKMKHFIVEKAKRQSSKKTNILMMSSGNFDGYDFEAIAHDIFE